MPLPKKIVRTRVHRPTTDWAGLTHAEIAPVADARKKGGRQAAADADVLKKRKRSKLQYEKSARRFHGRSPAHGSSPYIATWF
jgi:hypothetical protein